MNTILKQMKDKYDVKSIADEENAIKEILQELLLCGLSKNGFFEHAAFCGGTSLRIFYGINRFSEDLDFTLLKTDKNFDLNSYLEKTVLFLNEFGVDVNMVSKSNVKDKAVKSAFLKANTIETLVYFDTKFNIGSIRKNEQLKIKIEIDSNPPLGFNYETKISFMPEVYEVGILDLPSLFAGKLHAILCRFHDEKVKGRDIYDFVFYISKNVSPNLEYLKNAMVQSGDWDDNSTLDIEKVKELLRNKFEIIDYESAKNDVYAFLNNKDDIKLWKKEFFLQLVEMVK